MLIYAGANSPTVRVDNSQNAVSIWSCLDNETIVIQASKKISGGNWSVPEKISLEWQKCITSSLEMDCISGNATAIWIGVNQKDKILSLYGSMLPQGGSWTTPVCISNGTENVSSYETSLNDNGTIMVAWVAFNGQGLETYYSSTATIGTNIWSFPEEIYSP